MAERIGESAPDYGVATNTLRVVPTDRSTDIMIDDRRIMSVLDANAEIEGLHRHDLASAYVDRIRTAVEAYRRDRSPQRCWRPGREPRGHRGGCGARSCPVPAVAAPQRHPRTTVRAPCPFPRDPVDPGRPRGADPRGRTRRLPPRPHRRPPRPRLPLPVVRAHPLSVDATDGRAAPRLRPGALRDDGENVPRLHPQSRLPGDPRRGCPLCPAGAVARRGRRRAPGNDHPPRIRARMGHSDLPHRPHRRDRVRAGRRVSRTSPARSRPPSRGCRSSSASSSRSAPRRSSPT